ncbi:hypothetical protein [Streptomyces sp. R33]|uniref:Uncharacterized protein n=1 Tax=Streptomyces sp. R33 TaxID=3238629 RepID=A0AB39Y296_9ACTN
MDAALGDHGRDLGHYDEDDYARGAHDLMSGPRPPGVREKESWLEGKVDFDSSIRRDGSATNANAERYWNEQQGLEQ